MYKMEHPEFCGNCGEPMRLVSYNNGWSTHIIWQCDKCKMIYKG